MGIVRTEDYQEYCDAYLKGIENSEEKLKDVEP